MPVNETLDKTSAKKLLLKGSIEISLNKEPLLNLTFVEQFVSKESREIIM